MNMVWIINDGHIIHGDECSLNFLTLILHSWGKTPEKISTRKMTRPGIELGPAGQEKTMLHPGRSYGQMYFVKIKHLLLYIPGRATTRLFQLSCAAPKKSWYWNSEFIYVFCHCCNFDPSWRHQRVAWWISWYCLARWQSVNNVLNKFF